MILPVEAEQCCAPTRQDAALWDSPACSRQAFLAVGIGSGNRVLLMQRMEGKKQKNA